MTHPNETLIQRFYESFQALDYPGMIACYHPEIAFSDPVFPDLHGWRAGAMWRMLTSQARDLDLTFSDVHANDIEGQARWTARYTFSTGRPVENHIQARFRFRDGLIISHEDTFNLWRWTRMALGFPGTVLGWGPLLQAPLRKQASKGLDTYIQKHNLSAENVASR